MGSACGCLFSFLRPARRLQIGGGVSLVLALRARIRIP